jgi:hypothetical protein
MSTNPLLDAIRAQDANTLDRALADDVAFHSPVRSYRHRDDVIHLLRTIGGLLGDIEARRELSGPNGTATFLSASVAGKPIEGVLEQVRDGDGRVAEVTLMLRPLDAQLAAIERMGQALAAEPLPSAA